MPSQPRQRLEWTRAAREELREIIRYYARRFSPESAERVQRRIEARALQLTGFPYLGPMAEGLDPTRRRLQAGDYTLLYRALPEQSVVRIVSVRHSRRRPLTAAEIAALDEEHS